MIADNKVQEISKFEYFDLEVVAIKSNNKSELEKQDDKLNNNDVRNAAEAEKKCTCTSPKFNVMHMTIPQSTESSEI